MKVVIWGHKLHSHTHSYIHEAFFRAFEWMGFHTYWFDDSQTDLSDFNFSDTLFITEGQVEKNIPIRSDCRYVLHYCDPEKYAPVAKNCLFLERTFLGDDHLPSLLNKPDVEIVSKWSFFEKDYTGSFGWKRINNPEKIPALHILWGTNLLPHEIDDKWVDLKRTSDVNWVGTVGNGVYGNCQELGPFALACDINGNRFYQKSSSPHSEHIGLIQESYLAPTIVGTWQLHHGYIPCRIFKNISYGQPPFTNSRYVSDIFNGEILHNNNTFELFYQAREMASEMKKETMLDLMESVRKNHTYINRISDILRCFR